MPIHKVQQLTVPEKWVPYSQWYLFNAIPDTNHNAKPTNPNRNSKGNHNPTNSTNPNTRYCCEYSTRFSMIAQQLVYDVVAKTLACCQSGIPCVVEKNTMRRHEDGGGVVEKY